MYKGSPGIVERPTRGGGGGLAEGEGSAGAGLGAEDNGPMGGMDGPPQRVLAKAAELVKQCGQFRGIVRRILSIVRVRGS